MSKRTMLIITGGGCVWYILWQWGEPNRAEKKEFEWVYEFEESLTFSHIPREWMKSVAEGGARKLRFGGNMNNQGSEEVQGIGLGEWLNKKTDIVVYVCVRDIYRERERRGNRKREKGGLVFPILNFFPHFIFYINFIMYYCSLFFYYFVV